MTLPPEVTAALVALALTVIGALGTLVKVLVDRLAAKIDDNTALTKQVHTQTNGTLAKARDDLQRTALERDAYKDIIRYVKSHPDGARVLAEYAERRRVRVHDVDLDTLIGGGR